MNKYNKRPLDIQQCVDEHGDILFRYALGRLHNSELAEELVQDTFLSAIQSVKSFEGRATERTWLTGILKNKIVDYYRKRAREITVSDLNSEDSVEDLPDYFNQKGMWDNHKPQPWPSPDKALEQKEFWNVFKQCNEGLPKQLRNVFTLRELENLDRDEVCQVLNISTTNYWKLMQRARFQLRNCLEKNWFGHSA